MLNGLTFGLWCGPIQIQIIDKSKQTVGGKEKIQISQQKTILLEFNEF